MSKVRPDYDAQLERMAFFQSHRILIIVLAVSAGLGTGLLLVLIWLNFRMGPTVKARVEKVVADRFDSDVKLDRLDIQLLPAPHIEGYGLTVHHKHRTDVPPLITIQRFTADADFATMIGAANHLVRNVRLEGLVIQVPPGFKKANSADSAAQAPKHPIQPASDNHFPFEIGELIADGTILKILPRQEGREPMEFLIHKLRMNSVGLNQPMAFVATLTDAKPPGFIESKGAFGPWQKDDLGATPVSGDYTFAHADLAAFTGISGILSSVGRYEGTLNHIVVDGTTDTPDFEVNTGAYKVRLTTKFHAIVDGTTGDTALEPVKAKFLQTDLICRGTVAGQPGVKGKTVSLHVETKAGRIEDLTRLCVKTDKPVMTGPTRFNTEFVLPPGQQDVMSKLILNGQFIVAAARFTDPNIQSKLEALSRRSRGEVTEAQKAADDKSITSDLGAHFALHAGTLTLTDFQFSVPGAHILLNGTYGLHAEDIDLHGKAKLDAHLSQMTTGFKSKLLKLADPFFAKDGAGTVLPIKITGTRTSPSFGVDFHKMEFP
ncbi:MAG: hypothetical protein WBW33_21170 [Bryobacteraceae bacterium]